MYILLRQAGNIMPAPPLTHTYFVAWGLEQRASICRISQQQGGGEGKLETLGLLRNWGGWSLVIPRTQSRKGNLGVWLKISKHRSDPGPWIYILFFFFFLFFLKS